MNDKRKVFQNFLKNFFFFFFFLPKIGLELKGLLKTICCSPVDTITERMFPVQRIMSGWGGGGGEEEEEEEKKLHTSSLLMRRSDPTVPTRNLGLRRGRRTCSRTCKMKRRKKKNITEKRKEKKL